METLAKWEKIIFGSATFIVAAGSIFGFYLVQGEPAIKSLVASGHSHVLSFAYGAILYGLLMRRLTFFERTKTALAAWMSLTYFGPIALILAGLTGNTGFLMYTSPIFEGSFVLLWMIMAYNFLLKRS